MTLSLPRPQWTAAALAALLTFAAAGVSRADSTREYAPPPRPAPTPAALPTVDAAQTRINSGDYRDAIPILSAVIKADPRNADALNLMGFSLRMTGNSQLALQYYTSALSLQPRHLGANEYLGELYVELHQLDKAKERLAVLVAACGENCAQTRELAEAIATGQTRKYRR